MEQDGMIEAEPTDLGGLESEIPTGNLPGSTALEQAVFGAQGSGDGDDRPLTAEQQAGRALGDESIDAGDSQYVDEDGQPRLPGDGDGGEGGEGGGETGALVPVKPEDDHHLASFDMGNGVYRDLSFTDIRQAVARADEYHSFVENSRARLAIAENALTELGQDSGVYGRSVALNDRISLWLQDNENLIAPPDPKLLDDTANPENVAQFRAQNERHLQHQQRVLAAKRLREDNIQQQRDRQKIIDSRTREQVLKVAVAVWPALGKKEEAESVEAFLHTYGYTMQDVAQMRDPRMFSIMAKAYRFDRAMQSRQQRDRKQRRQPPRIVRGRPGRGRGRARQGGLRPSSGDGGPRHLKDAGDALLRLDD
ncbi:MAG: hypothetical protein OXC31_15625 [Spirochaetaceae bacterium]|nr:hypothetical protein [Spirochaetaceae bacterium]